MAFNLKEFIKNNLISGYNNGSFTTEQVNIYAVTYMTKGLLDEADIQEISIAITPVEEPIV